MHLSKIFIFLIFLLPSCSSTRKFTPVFSDDAVERPVLTDKIKFFLNDERKNQENQEQLFTGIRLSLNLKYKQSLQWVEAEDIPEKGLYIQMNIKEFDGTQKNMYWNGLVLIEILSVDKRNPEKVKESTQKFESSHKKFNFAGEETQFEVLEKSWGQVSDDILKYLDSVIFGEKAIKSNK